MDLWLWLLWFTQGRIHNQLTRRWEYLALSLTLCMWTLYVLLYVLYVCICVYVCVWTLTNDGDSELTYRRRPWVRAKRSSCPGSWRVGCRQPWCAVGRPHGLTAGAIKSERPCPVILGDVLYVRVHGIMASFPHNMWVSELFCFKRPTPPARPRHPWAERQKKKTKRAHSW